MQYANHEGSPVQPSPARQATSKTPKPPNNKQNYPNPLDAKGNPLPKPAEAMPASLKNMAIASPPRQIKMYVAQESLQTVPCMQNVNTTSAQLANHGAYLHGATRG